jgi:MFS family permease
MVTAAVASPLPRAESAVTRLRDVPRSLWLVLLSAFLGWLFDAADVSILTLLVAPSVGNLLGTSEPRLVAPIAGVIAGVKLVAWGLGGIAFGVVTDRIGRSRTMVITILIYSVFTGLSALAQSWQQLALLQAVAGIGIGGEWAAGAALVAETWPERLRTRALQLMQSAFAIGFFVAALVYLALGAAGWRWVFLAGAAPALLVLLVRRSIREPESWLAARERSGGANITLRRIFRPDLRKRTIVGATMAASMFLALFGATAWIPAWIPELLPTDQPVNVPASVAIAFLLANAGAVLGNLSLVWLTDAIGARRSYFIFCAGALVLAEVVFTQVHNYPALLVLMPVYGYFAIGGGGTLAAYLPVLFPTLNRGTGAGFCWNFARLLTGLAPVASGVLVAASGSYATAAAIMTLVYLVGLVAVWFGPDVS